MQGIREGWKTRYSAITNGTGDAVMSTKNQPETKIAGLSTNDAFNLAAFLKDNYDIPNSIEYVQADILEWQGDSRLMSAVGLNESQVKRLATHFVCEKPNVDSPAECHAVITKFLGGESFETQQFTPNWDDVPEGLNWAAQDANGGWYAYKNKPPSGVTTWGQADKRDSVQVCVNKDWRQTLQERPAPEIQVGQCWYRQLIEVDIIGLNANEVAVKEHINETFVIYNRADFLANFKLSSRGNNND